MQASRLAHAAARRTPWLFSSPSRVFSSASRSQTADPAIHSGELEAGPTVHRGQPHGIKSDETSAKFVETDHKEEDPFVSPKSPCDPSTKLKSTGVNQRLDPSVQQKRKQGSVVLEEVSCAGLDGTPWPNYGDRDREEQTEDDKEYYEHHKASPLSEVQFADSRKLVTRASNGKPSSMVIGWLPEQLDTAEDSLRRATEIWRQNAMRGDPDMPHSRVLRQLRGEDF